MRGGGYIKIMYSGVKNSTIVVDKIKTTEIIPNTKPTFPDIRLKLFFISLYPKLANRIPTPKRSVVKNKVIL